MSPGFRTVLRLLTAYGAVVLQVHLGAATVIAWPVLAIALAARTTTPVAGVWWAAGIGLLTDAAAHGRLGGHLVSAALAVATARAVCPESLWPRFGMATVLTVWLGLGDQVFWNGLGMLDGRQPFDWPITGSGVQTIGLTALVALLGEIVWETAQRLIRSPHGAQPIDLSNRWHMLAD